MALQSVALSCVIFGLFTLQSAAADDIHPPCSNWTEEISIDRASRRWENDPLLARRSAIRKPPVSFATDRGALMVDYKLLDVSAYANKAKVGTYKRYNTKVIFQVTFKKIPCDE